MPKGEGVMLMLDGGPPKGGPSPLNGDDVEEDLDDMLRKMSLRPRASASAARMPMETLSIILRDTTESRLQEPAR